MGSPPKKEEYEGPHRVRPLVFFPGRGASKMCIRDRGHAIWRAKRFVGDEPFAVLLGDDIMRARTPVIGQLIAAAEKYDASCVGVQQVSTDAIAKYSSVQISPLEERVFAVSDMVEKPRPEQIFSHYAILGRYVLRPGIFNILEDLEPGYGGEIQLTDGLKALCRRDKMVAVDLSLIHIW